MSKEAMKLAQKWQQTDWNTESPMSADFAVSEANDVISALIDALREALAEQPAQQGVLVRKWVLHGGFADVASFDAEGFPYFYWKESVAKFKAGELSTPCKGKNCGSLNGWLHSAECRAEHEAHYAVTKGNA